MCDATRVALVVGTLFLGVPPLLARPKHIEKFKLTASDAELGARFGSSVDISGNTAVIAARKDDHAGKEAGAAYLFDISTGKELFKLTASDAAELDAFGWSVAISDNTAIIGAPGNDDDGRLSGSAYLFDITTGNELFKLTASDASELDHFGVSVDISGTVALVGARYGVGAEGGTGFDKPGSAYLFDVNTGDELLKVTASDAEIGDQFGLSVAISGSNAIVGAVGNDDACVRHDRCNSGSAYLFDVTTGNELLKLTTSDAAKGDAFGNSVGVNGNMIIVGAIGDEYASGSAYVFDATTGKEVFKMRASDGVSSDAFAGSVDIAGDVAIIGAFNNDMTGSAYLFDVSTGEELFKLTASDIIDRDHFGTSVAIQGDIAIIGAFGVEATSSGAAYVFVIPLPATTSLLSGLCVLALMRRNR